jgi:hypothetical protein
MTSLIAYFENFGIAEDHDCEDEECHKSEENGKVESKGTRRDGNRPVENCPAERNSILDIDILDRKPPPASNLKS